MGNNYTDMDDYVRRLDRDRVRLIAKLKVRPYMSRVQIVVGGEWLFIKCFSTEADLMKRVPICYDS